MPPFVKIPILNTSPKFIAFSRNSTYADAGPKTNLCDRYNNREEAGMGPALTRVLSGGLMPLHAGEIPLTLVVSKADT